MNVGNENSSIFSNAVRVQADAKPYKSKDPFQTINEIRKILEQCGIFTCEYPYPSVDYFHSCGVFLSDHKVGDLHVGFFGKGMSSKYSLASAYAEFLERLQNNVLFTSNYASFFPLKSAQQRFLNTLPDDSIYKKRIYSENLALDFVFGPDEKVLPRDEVIINNKSILYHIFKTNSDEKLDKLIIDKEIICAHFYSVSTDQVEMLPIELMYRASVSNGMCAGNTPYEAILHGICEVFERYAVYSIYKNEITPPTIPLEVFEHTSIYQMVTYLENFRNIKIVIKDCSLGMNLPVMGVLVIDQNNNSYTFNLGSDPSPVVAVQRCLMEMYQGGPNIHYTALNLGVDPFAPSNGLTKDQQKGKAFYSNLYTGTSTWPNSIFNNIPTYPFTGFGFPQGDTDEVDVGNAVNILKGLGLKLYVRNCSYLGFPAYFVYIPGMSEGKYGFTGDSVTALSKLDMLLGTLHNLGGAEANDLEYLANILGMLSENIFQFEIRKALLHTGPTQLDHLSSDIFAMILYITIGNYEKALECVTRFYRENPDLKSNEHLFYFGIRDAIKLKIERKSDHEIRETIILLYGEDNAKNIISEFFNAKTMYSRLAIPACFNCDTCKINASCAHLDVLKTVKIVQEKQKNSNIKQEELRSVFKH